MLPQIFDVKQVSFHEISHVKEFHLNYVYCTERFVLAGCKGEICVRPLFAHSQSVAKVRHCSRKDKKKICMDYTRSSNMTGEPEALSHHLSLYSSSRVDDYRLTLYIHIHSIYTTRYIDEFVLPEWRLTIDLSWLSRAKHRPMDPL